MSWAVIPIYVIGILLFGCVCFFLYKVGSTEPGIVPKNLVPERVLRRDYSQQRYDFDPHRDVSDDDEVNLVGEEPRISPFGSDEEEDVSAIQTGEQDDKTQEEIIEISGIVGKRYFPPRKVQVGAAVFTSKYCPQCKRYRGLRMKHCHSCNNCVVKWDHHCPWTGTCIGIRNYRYFYLFVTSTVLLCTFDIIVTVLQTIILVIQEAKNNTDFGVIILQGIAVNPIGPILCVYGVVMVWSLLSLWGFHTYLIAKNQTTYEHIRNAYASMPNPFNKGIIANFKSVFVGLPPSELKWREMIPVHPNYLDDDSSKDSESTETIHVHPISQD